MKRFFLTLCAVCATTLAWAASATVDGIEWEYAVSNGEATITNCDSSAFDALEIPSTLGGCPVTSIGNMAFQDCFGLTSITIPEGVVEIGTGAFYNCVNLASVTIPNTVTLIEDLAFFDCQALQSVTIPSSVKSIGNSAFEDCVALADVTLCDGLEQIGRMAFGWCEELREIRIPSTVHSIGAAAFAFTDIEIVLADNHPSYEVDDDGHLFTKGREVLHTMKDTGDTSYTVPSGVKTIGGYAFVNMFSLEQITLPESVSSIEEGAFGTCSAVSFTVDSKNLHFSSDKNGLWNKAKTRLIRYVSNQANVKLSANVTEIDAGAFALLSSLRTIEFSEGVTSIGNSAFEGCTNLQSVKLPSTIETLGESAFNDCSALQVVDGLAETQIKAINPWCFEECSNLTVLTLPKGLMSIGRNAFEQCSALTEVIVPEGVSLIDTYAFDRCENLKSVIISSGDTSIAYMAFSHCSGLTSVTFLGAPPVADVVSFPETTGYYLSNYASQWKAVISNGKWNNLTMTCVEPPSFNVILTAVGSGSVSGGGEQTWDDSVTVTATADEGWVFCGWSTTPAVMTLEYTFTMPAEDVALTAYFAPKQAVDQAIQQHVTDNNLKTETEVAEAIQQHITVNNLMSKDAAVQDALNKDEVFTADEMKEMAFKAPVVEVGSDAIEISISLQTAEKLNEWNPMLLQGATLEVDQEAGKVRVRVPKGDKKAAFYKFVVPTDQSK